MSDKPDPAALVERMSKSIEQDYRLSVEDVLDCVALMKAQAAEIETLQTRVADLEVMLEEAQMSDE